VNGQPAVTKSDNSFEGKAAVTAGDNTITVAATDVNGNTATNRYNVAVTGSGSKTLVYDLNGNLTSDGTRTFEWDPLNRLAAVNSGTNRSEFTYNGLSQRVTIVEKDNGAVTSTKQLVWCPGDAQPYEERDVSNTVTKRYYPQGMQVGSTNYYYTCDHLGSVRELTDSSGAVQTRYDYDPYGRRRKLTGDSDADFGYTGHYFHQPSGLCLALYRAYDADLGRWISRDPIGEIGGINLYGYVGNDPLSQADPFGLWYIDLNIGFGFPIFLGPTGGLVFSSQGIQMYGGGGLMTPGLGGSLTWGGGSSHGFNAALQVAPIVAVQRGYTFGEDGGWFTEYGVGWGASLTAYGVSKPWNPFKRTSDSDGRDERNGDCPPHPTHPDWINWYPSQ